MGKLGGLLAITTAALVLSGCGVVEQEAAAVVEEVAVGRVAHISTEQQQTMIGELRPALVKLQASDSALYREAYEACANLLVRDKDSYREAVLSQYGDMELALDHLSVASAAKKYICP